MNRKKMHIIKGMTVWLLFCLAGIFMTGLSVQAEQPQQTSPCTENTDRIQKTRKSGRRVLFISSYEYSWSTVPLQMQGIEEALGDQVMMDCEFMDTKQVTGTEEIRIFHDHIRYKLSVVEPYDVIITGDDAALQFVLDYREELFAGIPVVFEGVNDPERAEKAAQDPQITGVQEQMFYKENLNLALQLYPDAERIIGIVDDTITGQGDRKQFYANQADYPQVTFEELNVSEYTQKEFIRKLSEIPKNSIVFYLICSEDRDGHVYTGGEAAALIAKYTDFPVFRMVQSGIGDGVFGGKIVSHRAAGKIAGGMALRIINGTPPSEIAMQTESPGEYYFDQEVMDRFHIRGSRLPRHAVLVHEKVSFVSRHAHELAVLFAIVSLILLAAGFAGVLWHLKQRNEALSVLRTRNHQLAVAIASADRGNEAKSRFLSSMSHEMRTPLHAIIGLTDIAREHTGEPEKMQSYLEKVDSSSQMLLQLINDILDMSAIENNKLKIAEEPFQLQEVMDSIGAVYRPLCDQKGIRLELYTADVPKETLLGDARRLRQIFNNLMSNALKFTDTGGKISVSVQRQKQTGTTVYLQFEVTDTGCGMSEDMKERLFLPFEQENTKTALLHGGSGLGLSIAKNMIERMHGGIRAESKQGKGTSFYVVLPFSLSTEQLAEKEQQASDLSGTRILVADDTPMSREITGDLLKMAGAQVDTAENGKEALQKYLDSGRYAYDAILLDIQMPVMDGYETVRAIRSSGRADAKEVPVLAMTANAFTEDVTASLQAGMNDHISKPIDTQVMYARIAEYCKAYHLDQKDGNYADDTTV